MKKLFVIFILSVTVFSCERYEENPIVSFRSILKRINGYWKIESTTFNSIPTSSDWDSLKVDSYQISFSNPSPREKRQYESDMDGGMKITFLGSIVFEQILATFSEDKKELKFWSHYSCHNFPNCNDPYPLGNIPGFITNDFNASVVMNYGYYYLQETWKIKKLTNKELWLTSELNGNSYETHFKKMEE